MIFEASLSKYGPLYIVGAIVFLFLIYFLTSLWRSIQLQKNLKKLRDLQDEFEFESDITAGGSLKSASSLSQDFYQDELSHLLNQLQDAVEDIAEEDEQYDKYDEYTEIHINAAKFRLLHGRLKSLCKRLDAEGRGYVLSCIVNMGLANNPFVLEDLDFSEAVCHDEIFFEADLSRIVAHDIDLNNAVLSSARLENAKLSYGQLEHARMDDVKASSAYLNSAQMEGAYLKGADLGRSYLIEADLTKGYLAEANLDGAIMRESNLKKANLSQASLLATNLTEANLEGAVIKDSVMHNVTLSEANLKSTYLTGADLDAADMWRADLSAAIFIGANFEGAYLNEAKFHGEYRDLKQCEEHDLEKMQELGIGLYSSDEDQRFDVGPTNFSKTHWWLANFDNDATLTLWRYLEENFPVPNGLDLTDQEWKDYEEIKEAKHEQIKKLKAEKQKEQTA